MCHYIAIVSMRVSLGENVFKLNSDIENLEILS